MSEHSNTKLLLNLTEAAELLGIKPSQLYEQTRARARARQRISIPHLRLGKRICFRRESKPRSKEPLLNRWPVMASSDPQQIEAWQTQFPGCNFGAAASDDICILESDDDNTLRDKLSRQLPADAGNARQ